MSDGAHRLDIHAGYCAVANFAESPVDAVEMLLRATTALHHARDEGEAIKSFDKLRVVAP
jgi:hypothetical protein